MARLESCPTCGNQTSENASQCPACGEPLSSGWTDTVREERAQATWKHKKAKWKKRLIWVSAFAALILWINFDGTNDNFNRQSLKKTNPAEHQKKIQKTKEKVAKVPASVAKTQDLSFVVEPSNLNVRSRPSSQGTKIDRLSKGTRVTIYDRNGRWSRISLSENRWVHSAYLVRQISGDLNYSVIDSDSIPGIKLSLVVELSRRASEKELKQIAQELKNGTRGSYERIFIVHYLPGMLPGSGAWATTHFSPSLKVAILGLTLKQTEHLVSTATAASQDVIGVWLVEIPMLAHRAALYRKGEKIFQKQKFKDGGENTYEMIERSSSSGRRFDMKEPNAAGDYLLLKPSGVLEVRDSEGLITTARPINAAKAAGVSSEIYARQTVTPKGTGDSSEAALAAEFKIELVSKVVGPSEVEVEVTSTIPGTITVMLGLGLAGAKPDDVFIGTNKRITLKNGRANATIGKPGLPAGKYEVEVSFYPRWGAIDSAAKAAGVNSEIHVRQTVTLKGTGESSEVAQQRENDQRWVMMNVYYGTPWDRSHWVGRFGELQQLITTRGNPHIMKAYYFKQLDMTIIVNELKGEVITWRTGRKTE